MTLSKKLTKLLAVALFTASAFAASDTIGYQGVAFNSGSPVASSNVGLRFTVYEDDNSTVVYQESATATTTDKGYFSHDIGSGTASGTAWSAVQWGDNYTLKTEIDVAGGTSYTNLGIQEFKSVAYAKSAQVAPNYLPLAGGTITGDIQMGAGDFIHYDGSSNDYFGWSGLNDFRVYVNNNSRISMNNIGTYINASAQNLDFRVSGDTKTNLLFVDAGNDKVSIDGDLSVSGSFSAGARNMIYSGQVSIGETTDLVTSGDIYFRWDGTAKQMQFKKNGANDIAGGCSVVKTSTQYHWYGYLTNTWSRWYYMAGRDQTSSDSNFTPSAHAIIGDCRIQQFNGSSYFIKYVGYHPQNSSYKVGITIERVD